VVLTTDSIATIENGRKRFALPFDFVHLDREALERGPFASLRHAAAGPGGSDVVYATTILLDAQGVVRWKHVPRDLRDRPTPQAILAAATP
jgi:hypothetical protein